MLYYMDTNGQVVCVIISSQLKAKTYVFSKSFEKCLDENLQHLNIYYRDLISDKVLSRLKVKIVKRKSFINFMKSIGKLGGQNKVPRLSNDREIIDRIISLNKI